MHPLRIGSLYGLIAAVVQVATIYVNHKVLSSANGFVGFFGAFLIPLVLLYLSGHFAGRHKRLTEKTTATSGPNAILHGTSAGVTSGLIFIILVGLSGKYLGSFLGIANAHDVFGSVLGALGFVFALIGWFFAGLILGSLGGLFGDSLAHKQLKA